MRRLVVIALLFLAAAPAAFAAYPTPLALQGGQGLTTEAGLRFVASAGGNGTTKLTASRGDDVVLTNTISGVFGIPTATYKGPQHGLFRDGSAFVLQNVGYAATSEFRIVNTSDLSVRDVVSLRGTFAYDALSPDGSRLYLIQHSSVDQLQHYVVRAYDLRLHALLPGRIADRKQRGWVMEGFPMSRVESVDGRWAYTLYWNPGGAPFVHALDTVAGKAHCIGFAPPSEHGGVFDYALQLSGNKLLVRDKAAQLYRTIDRKTWRVTKP